MSERQESQHAAAAPALADTTVIANHHLKAMASVLERQNGLLEIPRSTFDILAPYLTGDVGGIIFDEIEHHIRSTEGEEGRYWCEGDYNTFLNEQLSDIELLASFAGHELEACGFLIEYGPRNMRFYGLFGAEEDVVEIAEEMDRVMKKILRNYLARLANEKLSDKLDLVVQCMKADRAMPVSKFKMDRSKDAEHFILDPNPIFKDSLDLVRAWHSRKFGLVVTEKLAGHALPTELVEMIAENFYDHEVLQGF